MIENERGLRVAGDIVTNRKPVKTIRQAGET
jgi:hypothetical protein